MRFQFLFESFLSTFCFGHLLEIRRVLNFLTFPSNIAFEEFFLGSLRASTLPKPLLNALWVTAVGVALKCFSTRLKMCTHIEDSFFLEQFFLCRGGERGYCVIRD